MAQSCVLCKQEDLVSITSPELMGRVVAMLVILALGGCVEIPGAYWPVSLIREPQMSDSVSEHKVDFL